MKRLLRCEPHHSYRFRYVAYFFVQPFTKVWDLFPTVFIADSDHCF
ncbi:MAG: hypothetical protein LBJ00_10435 [Planctomycetaceae bacterium]|nr:hypothetical protein [Planctomycetaceae bacterium]